MKWRVFITFQILCYICIYALWSYVTFSPKGPRPGSPDYKAWNHRVTILCTLYTLSIIKAVADCILFYYAFKIVNALVK